MHIPYRRLSIAAAMSLTLAPGSPVAVAQIGGATLPVRVGRIASITGTVSYHLADAERWQPASINLPLTDGMAIGTEPASRAELGFGSNKIALDASTEFDLNVLDEHALLATEPQGESYLHLRVVPTGDSYSVATPRGIVAITGVGRYAIIAGDQAHPTLITVLEGTATVTGLPAPQQVETNQTLTITGDGKSAPFQPSVGPAVRDPFLNAMLAAERPAPRQAVAPPAYVARMTGADALDEYGEWASSPEYGAVWYPRVATDFVPYRDGRWAYVQPWGWTWVDNAPWGFAPFHYGRWAYSDGRWGWVPGRPGAPQALPVYAPALVGFLGGAAAGAVTWFPLGPNEPYRPPYQASEQYMREVNQFNVANLGDLGRPYERPPVNRNAITSVPADVMTTSRNVAEAPRLPPPPVQERPQIAFEPPVKPSTATVGVTQAMARQLDLPRGPARAAGQPGAAPVQTLPTTPSGTLPGLRPGTNGRPLPQTPQRAPIPSAAAQATEPRVPTPGPSTPARPQQTEPRAAPARPDQRRPKERPEER